MEPTYAYVGATQDMTAVPPGFQYVERRGLLGSGDTTFANASRALRQWQFFRAAGLAVQPGRAEVATGVDVKVGIRLGPARIWAPCRVVWVTAEADRYGFGYGTLPGHPFTGEEAFLVIREPDGKVWFEIRAFSRPAVWYTKAAGPLARSAQRWAAGRYLNGLRKLV